MESNDQDPPFLSGFAVLELYLASFSQNIPLLQILSEYGEIPFTIDFDEGHAQ
jgi:hypothetical protein